MSPDAVHGELLTRLQELRAAEARETQLQQSGTKGLFAEPRWRSLLDEAVNHPDVYGNGNSTLPELKPLQYEPPIIQAVMYAGLAIVGLNKKFGFLVNPPKKELVKHERRHSEEVQETIFRRASWLMSKRTEAVSKQYEKSIDDMIVLAIDRSHRDDSERAAALLCSMIQDQIISKKHFQTRIALLLVASNFAVPEEAASTDSSVAASYADRTARALCELPQLAMVCIALWRTMIEDIVEKFYKPNNSSGFVGGATTRNPNYLKPDPVLQARYLVALLGVMGKDDNVRNAIIGVLKRHRVERVYADNDSELFEATLTRLLVESPQATDLVKRIEADYKCPRPAPKPIPSPPVSSPAPIAPHDASTRAKQRATTIERRADSSSETPPDEIEAELPPEGDVIFKFGGGPGAAGGGAEGLVSALDNQTALLRIVTREGERLTVSVVSKALKADEGRSRAEADPSLIPWLWPMDCSTEVGRRYSVEFGTYDKIDRVLPWFSDRAALTQRIHSNALESYNKSDFHAARRYLNALINLMPETPDYLNWRAMCALSLCDLNESSITQEQDAILMDLREALRLAPDHVGALCSMGRVLILMKDYSGAVAFYDRAVEVAEPTTPGLRGSRALALVYSNRIEEALADLSVEIGLQPSNVGFVRWRYQCYGRLERWDEALADLNTLFEMIGRKDIQHGIYKQNIAYDHAYRGRIYFQIKNRFGDALAEVHEALKLHQGDARTYALAGEIYEATSSMLKHCVIIERRYNVGLRMTM